MITTSGDPDGFFAALRGMRRVLSASSLIFGVSLGATVALWLRIGAPALWLILLGLTAGGLTFVVRFERRSDASYRATLEPTSSACTQSDAVAPCSSGACAATGVSCHVRLGNELRARVADRERQRLAGYVGMGFFAQMGLILLWPVVTLGAVISGALPRTGGIVTLGFEIFGVGGLCFVRFLAREIAGIGRSQLEIPGVGAAISSGDKSD